MGTDDAKEQLKEYYNTKKELKEAIENDEIYDTLHEIADSNVDVYTNQLLEWVKDNYHYVEEAIDEFGHATDRDGKPDFIRQIMQGQYQQNMEALNKAVEELKEELKI